MDDPRMADSRMRMRTAAILYLSAGVLVIASLLLSSGHQPLGYVVPSVAVVTGLLLLPVGERMFIPLWVNELLSLGGSLLIGVLVVFVNPMLADVPGVFVVYVAAYAYFFYERGRALLHAAICAAAYGIGLVVSGVDFWFARWLVIAGASIVASVLVTRLAETDRRAATIQRELAERTRRLASTRELLLVAVSHELRTPLTLVAGTASILNERLEDLPPARLRELVTSQDAHAQRLVRLVEDLDALHQLSQEALVAGREVVDLHTTCAESVPPEMVDDVRLRIDAPSVPVRLDPRFIRRIIDNLLRNAVRHTPAGSEVLLSARLDGDRIVLEVADAGAGIPDAHKSAVFEPFVRLHTERAGSGVGLALVAALARAHGGTATVVDRDGGGSIFRVTLAQAVGTPAPLPF
ncbi:MAG: hypothetical protein KY461_06195 [Actinobacteria bacterium]|nr:hypothetical protein [Actinomycetota bacterium]